jgi:hypothetical protein
MDERLDYVDRDLPRRRLPSLGQIAIICVVLLILGYFGYYVWDFFESLFGTDV